MNGPLVSVVIPCYNQGRYLGEAIESALAQDLNAQEVIVINDGSTERSGEVARSFGERIRYLDQENRGVSAARNAGIRLAAGRYIAFLDADDLCLPGRLSTQTTILDRHPNVGLVACDAFMVNEAGERFQRLSRTGIVPNNRGNFRWETVSYCALPSTVMVRRECFEHLGGFEDSLRSMGEDWLMWVKLSFAYDMTYIDSALVGYRIHSQNATNQFERFREANRQASTLSLQLPHFNAYPPAFRAKLLYYRFATSWWSESKSRALRYFWRAFVTDPLQIGYGLTVIGQGVRNTTQRLFDKFPSQQRELNSAH